ncbi:MAG: amidohydrolase family protein [Planctomycetes bacterium]|nr:amidohydrolase family protein [Planctomycetota bacterium]
MRSSTSLSLALAALVCSASLADEPELVVIRAARVITVSGEEFAPGMIVAKDGKIQAVGQRIEVPEGAKEFDLGERVLMPGLVAPRTRFGLRGYTRRGNQVQQRAAIELVVRPDAWDGLLEAGVVAAAVYPEGSDLPGRAVVVHTHPGAPAERILLDPGYLRVGFDALPGNKRTLRGALKAAEQAIEKEEKAKAEWEKKTKPDAGKPGAAPERPSGKRPPRRGPRRGPPQPPRAPLMAGAAEGQSSTAPVDTTKFNPPPIPEAVAPFVDLLRKDKAAPRLFVELGRASDLVHFDEVCAEVEWPQRPVFFAPNRSTRSIQTDFFRVVERLGEEQELVLLHPAISVEESTFVRVNLAEELSRAGCKVAFVPVFDARAGYDALLDDVTLLVGEGLSRDAALKGLTLHAAEAAGVADLLGSLEVGKRADFVVLDGDPLQVGARVEQVWIGANKAWTREVSR